MAGYDCLPRHTLFVLYVDVIMLLENDCYACARSERGQWLINRSCFVFCVVAGMVDSTAINNAVSPRR
jgi:hypothetical protein